MAAFPAGSFAGDHTVVVDGNVITASGMGQALPFALAIPVSYTHLDVYKRQLNALAHVIGVDEQRAVLGGALRERAEGLELRRDCLLYTSIHVLQ